MNNELLKADIQALIDAAIKLSAPLLIKHSALVPFGLSLGSMRKISVYGFEDGDGSSSADLFKVGSDILRNAADADENIKAVAIVFEGRLRREDRSILNPNVLMIQIDHADLSAATYHVPFRIKRPMFRAPIFEIVADTSHEPTSRIAFQEHVQAPT